VKVVPLSPIVPAGASASLGSNEALSPRSGKFWAPFSQSLKIDLNAGRFWHDSQSGYVPSPALCSAGRGVGATSGSVRTQSASKPALQKRGRPSARQAWSPSIVRSQVSGENPVPDEKSCVHITFVRERSPEYVPTDAEGLTIPAVTSSSFSSAFSCPESRSRSFVWSALFLKALNTSKSYTALSASPVPCTGSGCP
jgi:hypothetical protein